MNDDYRIRKALADLLAVASEHCEHTVDMPDGPEEDSPTTPVTICAVCGDSDGHASTCRWAIARDAAKAALAVEGATL